ncbi:DUF3137 domain-containing protein [uncultured Campylobacter sp.]|mgnify:CR=1 FL=1|uniref:DUF3137 domain-containing protein n=1 Tax=uncultured Campylobacter sp. TaxID=218934 RepID=UPI00263537E1|nr:DUF3137 domain-containing protein [uncultured Campylobacter sp.]
MNINEAIVATAKRQKECRLAFIKYLFLGILFIIALPVGGGFAVGHLFENRLAPLFFIIIYIPFFLAALMANASRVIDELGDYKAFYKDVFVRAAIREVDPNFNYDPNAGISRKEFRKIGIYSLGEFRAEDQISGIYNGVKFSLSEAIDIPNDAKLNLGDSATLNLLSAIIFAWESMKDMQAFSGSVLVYEFYKKFNGQTIVASRTLNTKFLGEKEQMDDTLFNDEFRVFADDKVEARYLLTPAFMKRLRELKIKYAAEMGVSAAFMDDKFYLFLNGAENKFETTIFSLPPSLYDVNQIKKEISDFLSIIDELNLNLDIFK